MVASTATGGRDDGEQPVPVLGVAVTIITLAAGSARRRRGARRGVRERGLEGDVAKKKTAGTYGPGHRDG